jgi:hypothetical protein
MSATYDKIIKGFAQAIKESGEKGTSPYDTTAEVLRVNGDTAWVHIAGGVDETPVKKTIDCKAGDMVQLRVGGGRAWITGNATAPPTDDTKANKANETALSANKKAVTAYKTAEAEARDRKLIIREVAAGIEIGFENGGFKALINGEGSFDIVNADGETIASYADIQEMVSTSSVETQMGTTVTTTNRLTITPDTMKMYQAVDTDGTIETAQTMNLDAWGIRPDPEVRDADPSFVLEDGVYGTNKTPLWYSEVGTPDSIEGTCYVGGYLTGGKTKIRFTIPLTCPVAEGQYLDIMYINVTARQNGNYIVGDPDEPMELDSDRLTTATTPSGINVQYDFPSALSGSTNNDAVGFYVQYSFNALDGSPHITATFIPEEHIVHSTDTLESLKDYLEVDFWENGVDTPVDVSEVMLNGELVAHSECKIIAFWGDYATSFWVEVDS